MKKVILLIGVLAFYIQGFSQQIVFTDNTATNNWLAYQSAGMPPSVSTPWFKDFTTSGWGAPVDGFLATLNFSPTIPAGAMQNFMINPLYGIAATASNRNNYIMRPGGFLDPPNFGGDKSYFKYVFNVDPNNACKDFILKYNVDDSITIYVNGVKMINAYNPGWQPLQTLNISPNIRCGQNIISVVVTDRGGMGYFFIGDLSMQQSTFDNFVLGHGPLSCTSTQVVLNAGGIPGATYFWKGPNNFTSNQANPILNFQAGSIDGWYYCTVVKNACCQYTKKIFIHKPSDCCDAYIEPNVQNCLNYIFKLKSDVVDLDCWKWTIDGSAPMSQEELHWTLTPGNHTICVKYLGSSLSNPANVCCGEKCITVNVPFFIEPTSIVLTLPEGVNCMGFSPCEPPYKPIQYSNFRYTLSSSNPQYAYDSDLGYYDPNWNNGPNKLPGKWISGCIWHCLIRGTYTFNYYDENGCLIKSLQVTVQ